MRTRFARCFIKRNRGYKKFSANLLIPRAATPFDSAQGAIADTVPLSKVEGWSLSKVEGWSLSKVEGWSLSGVEGWSLSGVEGWSLSGVEGRSLSGVEGNRLGTTSVDLAENSL